MAKKKLSTILAWTLSIAMAIGSVNVAGAAEVPQLESAQTEDSQTYEDCAENRQEDIIKDDVDIFNAGDVSQLSKMKWTLLLQNSLRMECRRM